MVAWAVPIAETPQLLAGVLMGAMAIGVRVIGFRGRTNRALALYLALASAREVLGSLDDPARAPLLTSWVFRVLPWFDIALAIPPEQALRVEAEVMEASA